MGVLFGNTFTNNNLKPEEMKTLIVIAIVAFAVAIPFKKANAQYAIPSYDVAVVQNTTFEDSGFSQKGETREERVLTVEVEDEHRGGGKAWATFVIYSLDNNLQMGPFKAKEDKPFEISLSNGNWGILVTNASEDCQMSAYNNE